MPQEREAIHRRKEGTEHHQMDRESGMVEARKSKVEKVVKDGGMETESMRWWWQNAQAMKHHPFAW